MTYAPFSCNDKTTIGKKSKKSKEADYFKVSDAHGGRIKGPSNGSSRLVSSPERYITEAFEPFKERLRNDWTKGFQALMKYDQYCVRGFMGSLPCMFQPIPLDYVLLRHLLLPMHAIPIELDAV